MISLILGNSIDDKKKIKKNFTERLTLEGVIKEPTSVLNPSILIEQNLSLIAGCNYAYIPALKRYYYIDNMKSGTNDTCTVELKVDVLMSFKDEILACAGYVDRNQDIVSYMISDAERTKQVNPAISTVPFTVPQGNDGYTYCLITTKSV